MMPIKALQIVVYAEIVILIIAAVKTALPEAKASKPCLLGYKALCSFTPISTIILIVAAIVVFFLSREMIA